MQTQTLNRTEKTAAEKSQRLLVWRTGDELFALDPRQCREIETDPVLVRVPHCPDAVAGIVNLRGDVVTVLCLPVLLGRDARAATGGPMGAIVRLRDNRADVALRADRIVDILDVPAADFAVVPAHFNATERKFARGVATTSVGLAIILNCESFFAI